MQGAGKFYNAHAIPSTNALQVKSSLPTHSALGFPNDCRSDDSCTRSRGLCSFLVVRHLSCVLKSMRQNKCVLISLAHSEGCVRVCLLSTWGTLSKGLVCVLFVSACCLRGA